MRKNKLLIIVAASLVLAMILAYCIFKPSSELGSKSITVEVEHLSSAGKVISFKTDAEYLREALEEMKLVEGTESEYGLWVTTVDGEVADESLQQWWGYTVNGEFAEYGVDSQPVHDGDIYVFTLSEGY